MAACRPFHSVLRGGRTGLVRASHHDFGDDNDVDDGDDDEDDNDGDGGM